MKSLQLTLLCFLYIANSYGQTVAKNYYCRIVVEITKEKKPNKLYTKVEIKSGFPGGDSAWVQSLEKRLDQSIQVGKRVKKGRYFAAVIFIVAKDGSLSDISCEKDPGFGLCAEVMRVLKKSTKWVPAEPAEVRAYRVTSQ
jgi:hypothetical protein